MNTGFYSMGKYALPQETAASFPLKKVLHNVH